MSTTANKSKQIKRKKSGSTSQNSSNNNTNHSQNNEVIVIDDANDCQSQSSSPNIIVKDLPSHYQLLISIFPRFLPLISLYWSRGNFPNYSQILTVLPAELREKFTFSVLREIAQFAKQIELFELKLVNEIGLVVDGDKRKNDKIKKNYMIDQSLKQFENNKYVKDSHSPIEMDSPNNNTSNESNGNSNQYSEYVLHPVTVDPTVEVATKRTKRSLTWLKTTNVKPHEIQAQFKFWMEKFNKALINHYATKHDNSDKADHFESNNNQNSKACTSNNNNQNDGNSKEDIDTEDAQLPQADLPVPQFTNKAETTANNLQLKPNLTVDWVEQYQLLARNLNSDTEMKQNDSNTHEHKHVERIGFTDYERNITPQMLNSIENNVEPDADVKEEPNNTVQSSINNNANASTPSSSSSSESNLVQFDYPQYPLLSYLLFHLRKQRFYRSQISNIFTRPGKPAQFVPLNQLNRLELDTREILRKYGLKELYLHQQRGIYHLLDGKHLVLATSTNSGKSLVYLMAIINSIVKHHHDNVMNLHHEIEKTAGQLIKPSKPVKHFPRAFYLAPTKALAQDQLRKFTGLFNVLNQTLANSTGHKYLAAVYDGDTEMTFRTRLRTECTVLLTNPDMLNSSILPSALSQFASFFQNLEYVILDEIHLYCGVFGSHVALIMRRLQRIYNYFNRNNPNKKKLQFICCSGTISNAQELAQLIINQPVEILDIRDDSSEQSVKHFIFWNPPKVKRAAKSHPPTSSVLNTANLDYPLNFNDPNVRLFYLQFHTYYDLSQQNRRRSSFIETAILTANLMQINVKSIVFGRVRKTVEVLYQNTVKTLDSTSTTKSLSKLVRSYRGGYSTTNRREIENMLFNNQLLAVITTSALEIGIDIGEIIASIHLGYQGSASFWQQVGRAGRTRSTNNNNIFTKEALCLFVAFDTPFDQHLINNPNELLDPSQQRVFIDPQNITLLTRHIKQSLEELPISNDFSDRDYKEIQELFKISNDELHDILTREDLIFSEESSVLVETKALSALESQFIFHQETIESVESNFTNSLDSNENDKQKRDKYFNIRSVNPTGDFDIINVSTNSAIDYISGRKIVYECFVGAIYLNQGNSYIVQNLDMAKKQVLVKPIANPYYYTKCRDTLSVVVVQKHKAYDTIGESHNIVNLTTSDDNKTSTSSSNNNNDDTEGDHGVITPYVSVFHMEDSTYYGRVQIDAVVFGYHKILASTGQIIDTIPLTIPHVRYETDACWISLPVNYKADIVHIEDGSLDLWAGLHGINHCLINILPFYINYSSGSNSHSDFGTDCPSVFEKSYKLRHNRPIKIIVYEKHSLLGITKTISKLFPQLLQQVAQIIFHCSCAEIRGCPSCIQSVGCTELNEVMDKRAAKWILKQLLSIKEGQYD